MTKPKLWVKELEKEYKSKLSLYEKFCAEIAKQLGELFYQCKISTAFPIQKRVKSWKSMLDKCEMYHLEPKKLEHIEDLAGLRVILLFKRDLNKACEIIKKYFNVLKIEDTQERLRSDRFGYSSIHY